MRQHFGFLIMKPDALKLWLAEDLIDIVCTEHLLGSGIELFHAEVLEDISPSILSRLYPDMESSIVDAMDEYFIGQDIAIVIFYSPKERDMEEWIKKVKGPRIRDWTLDQINGDRSVTQFLRAALPVIGTMEQMKPVIDRFRQSKETGEPIGTIPTIEFKHYVKNLVHSPEGEIETLGVLSVLSPETRDMIFEALV